jgi:hypothetical protein
MTLTDGAPRDHLEQGIGLPARTRSNRSRFMGVVRACEALNTAHRYQVMISAKGHHRAQPS